MARKRNSRPARWADAAGKLAALKTEVESALEELKSIQEEYNDWYDNMSENLKGGATGEKLEAIQSLDLDQDLDWMEEAESMDLPLGFGRD